MNIIIMTPGHTGSRVLAGLFHTMGWHIPERNSYNEPYVFRNINQLLASGEHVDDSHLKALLATTPQPWCLKDLYWCHTLPRWEPLFRSHVPAQPYVNWNTGQSYTNWNVVDDVEEPPESPLPLLIWSDRNTDDVIESFRRREEDISEAKSRMTQCSDTFEHWPGPKLHVHYEDLQRWVGSFVLPRPEVPRPKFPPVS